LAALKFARNPAPAFGLCQATSRAGGRRRLAASHCQLLIDVAKASGDVTSNRLRATLATVLGWAIRQGIKLPEGNVAAYTSKRREKTRERVLSDGEIRTLWHALDDYDHGTITKLLLLTGQRRAEIGSLRWDEVHDDFILLSGERTKNKRQHVIPLSEAAKEILCRRRIAGRTYVFGRDIAGFNGWGVPKRRLDKRLAKARTPLKQWTLHDLRRTCVTGMIGLGIQPHVVEAVVNHVGGHRAGVAGIYNRASYNAEKREALDKWVAHVLAVVG
jgi:integrase